jgi:hypothetical protein
VDDAVPGAKVCNGIAHFFFCRIPLGKLEPIFAGQPTDAVYFRDLSWPNFPKKSG